MIKHANKKFEKIYNDVNAIYSYILTSSEIEKISNNIIKILKVNSNKKNANINEKDILLITYADTIKSKKKKPLTILNDFLKNFIKKFNKYSSYLTLLSF